MKILIPTLEAWPFKGGIAVYIKMLQEALLDCAEANVVEFPKNIGLFARVKWLISRSKEYDRVFVHHIFPVGFAAFLGSLFSSLKYVVFLHGNDFDQARMSFRSILISPVLNRADLVVVNSESLKKDVKRITKTEVRVIYPTTTAEFENSVKVKNHKSGDLKLITVCRLVKRKGVEAVLRAIKGINDVHYTIVGDGPDRAYFEEIVAELDLQSKVSFLGVRNHAWLAEHYADFDAFAMPTIKTESDREGFGIVYVEAQLAGLPVVTSDFPEVREAVSENQPSVKEGGLVEVIKSLKDVQLRKKLGAEGREFALKNHSVTVRKEIIKSVLCQR